MKPNYPPLQVYRITYNSEEKQFYMFDRNGECVGQNVNGRELGRDAWELYGADEVRYDYDLKLDENLLLSPRHVRYKK